MKVNLRDAFGSFSDHWSPRVAAELNGQQVRIAKVLGEFEWHSHEREDELFWVHRGELVIEFRGGFAERFEGGACRLREGELLVVPRGVEHRPVAEAECEIVLFEPAGTVNTGANEGSARTAAPRRL